MRWIRSSRRLARGEVGVARRACEGRIATAGESEDRRDPNSVLPRRCFARESGWTRARYPLLPSTTR